MHDLAMQTPRICQTDSRKNRLANNIIQPSMAAHTYQLGRAVYKTYIPNVTVVLSISSAPATEDRIL